MAKKKKYSRDGENPTPWHVGSLSVPRRDRQVHKQTHQGPSWEMQFFQSSNFSVKNSVFGKAVGMKFPDYLYMSNNYYEQGWGLKTHRRLKNVIIIMEFCPSKSMLQEVAAGKSFAATHEKILKRAFATPDGRTAAYIKVSELKEVLRAVDVIGDDEKEKEKFLSSMNLDPNGTVTFDELTQSKSITALRQGNAYVICDLVLTFVDINASPFISAEPEDPVQSSGRSLLRCLIIGRSTEPAASNSWSVQSSFRCRNRCNCCLAHRTNHAGLQCRF